MLVFTDVLIYGSHGLIFQSMQVNTENWQEIRLVTNDFLCVC
jgi:hypothetical protein